MFKRTALSILFFVGLYVLSPKNSIAQKAGLGLTYGNKYEMVGASLSGTYRFHRYFRIAGNANIFLPKDNVSDLDKTNWWSVNLDGHFVFLDQGRIQTYALAGLNYATIKLVSSQNGAVDVDSKLGFNTGGGIEYVMDFGHIYGESKYVFINERYQQWSIDFGVRFYLSERK